MNDTQPITEGGSDDRGFEPGRIRTILDMRRSRDDRLVAGVCGGVARHLDIDPVLVRVVIAAMTLVGFAGPILYLAAWFLVPSDDAERSVAADWFNLGEKEEQVRAVGLIGAAAVAGLSIIGDSSWGWGPPAFGLLWVVVPVAVLYWLFAVVPRRRRAARAATVVPASAATSESTSVLPNQPETVQPRQRRPRRSPALAFLTFSVAAVALGLLGVWDAGHPDADISWLTYVATALGVIGLGLLVGAVVGHALWLTPLGVLLAIALAIGTLLPSAKIGQDHSRPLAASQVQSRYELGIGDLVLDLTDVDDVEQLRGRRITIEQGIGSVEVLVPRGLAVRVDSHVKAGDLDILGERTSGTDRSLHVEGLPAMGLTIDASLGLGQIKVVTP